MAHYPLTPSESEYARLELQGEMYSWITREFFEKLFLHCAPKRVLDVGCGIGSVSRDLIQFLAGDVEIVAIDRNPEVIQYAVAHSDASLANTVHFQCGDWVSEACTGRYDLIVGRCILMYLDDPPSTLQSLISALRPGTVIAFQEPDHRSHMRTIPESEEFSEMAHGIENAARSKSIKVSLGLTLEGIIRTAGFDVFCHHRAGRVDAGPDSRVYDLLAQTAFSIPGALENCKSVPATSADLSARLRDVACQKELQILTSTLVGIGGRVR